MDRVDGSMAPTPRDAAIASLGFVAGFVGITVLWNEPQALEAPRVATPTQTDAPSAPCAFAEPVGEREPAEMACEELANHSTDTGSEAVATASSNTGPATLVLHFRGATTSRLDFAIRIWDGVPPSQLSETPSPRDLARAFIREYLSMEPRECLELLPATTGSAPANRSRTCAVFEGCVAEHRYLIFQDGRDVGWSVEPTDRIGTRRPFEPQSGTLRADQLTAGSNLDISVDLDSWGWISMTIETPDAKENDLVIARFISGGLAGDRPLGTVFRRRRARVSDINPNSEWWVTLNRVPDGRVGLEIIVRNIRRVIEVDGAPRGGRADRHVILGAAPTALCGRVVDDTGSPVVGTVTIGDPNDFRSLRSETDEVGRFEFRGELERPIHWRVDPKDRRTLEPLDGDLSAAREELRIVLPRLKRRVREVALVGVRDGEHWTDVPFGRVTQGAKTTLGRVQLSPRGGCLLSYEPGSRCRVAPGLAVASIVAFGEKGTLLQGERTLEIPTEEIENDEALEVEIPVTPCHGRVVGRYAFADSAGERKRALTAHLSFQRVKGDEFETFREVSLGNGVFEANDLPEGIPLWIVLQANGVVVDQRSFTISPGGPTDVGTLVVP